MLVYFVINNNCGMHPSILLLDLFSFVLFVVLLLHLPHSPSIPIPHIYYEIRFYIYCGIAPASAAVAAAASAAPRPLLAASPTRACPPPLAGMLDPRHPIASAVSPPAPAPAPALVDAAPTRLPASPALVR